MHYSFVNNLRSNWKSGLTVGLVSVPLAVSLAVASNTTPLAGIITAIWAGLIASLFGGSNYNIIGPTGALSGLLALHAQTHGAHTLPMLAIIAGVFILLAYFFNVGRYLVFVSGSVLHGFILGIAAIIIFNQINYALGLSDLPKHKKIVHNLIESLHHIESTSLQTLALFLGALITLWLLSRYLPKIPGTIIVASGGIALGYAAQNNFIGLSWQTLGAKFPNLSAALYTVPSLHFSFGFIMTGFTVALVALLETMVSARIADGVTKTKHNKNKEILGLGIANIASGLAGGIPATAALARTSLNIRTGCTNKLSATISSIAIAVMSLAFLTYFRYLPLAIIAAILVFISVRMIEPHHLIHMFILDKRSFCIALIVAFVTMHENPIIGILLGSTISMVLFMEKLSKGHYELITSAHEGIPSEAKTTRTTLIYIIKGHLAYINAQAHIAYFEQDLGSYQNVILKFRDLYLIDLDGVEAFGEIVDLIERQNKTVLISGINPLIENLLQENIKFRALKQKGLIFKSASEALSYIKSSAFSAAKK